MELSINGLIHWCHNLVVSLEEVGHLGGVPLKGILSLTEGDSACWLLRESDSALLQPSSRSQTSPGPLTMELEDD